MDSISDVNYSGNGLPGDETVSCTTSTVLVPCLDSDIRSVSGVQNKSNLATNVSRNSELFSKEYLDEIPSAYGAACNDLQDICRNNVFGNETSLGSKIVPPTIFENAVNAVKNLFSPVKGHGIFSRGVPQGVMQELVVKIPNKDNHFNGGSLGSRLDLASPTDNKVSPLISMENNLNLMEDTNNSNTFNSVAPGVHDSTNDSYTTTLSIMDESFQSTITHFDDNVPNEIGIPNVPVSKANYLDDSLNDTMKTNENSLDNTLRKNLSMSPTINGDANKTFEVFRKLEDKIVEEFNVGSAADNVIMQSSNHILSFTEPAESKQEIITSISVSEENFQAYQDTEIFKAGASCSTPKRCNSLENINLLNGTFFNLVPEKLHKFENMDQETIDKCKNSMVGSDNLKLSPFSKINQPSETNLSCIHLESENEFREKTSTPKCSGVEKNYSTSTVILTNENTEKLDFSSAKKITDSSLDLIGKEDKLRIDNEIGSPKAVFIENQSEMKSNSLLEIGIKSNNVEKNISFDVENIPDKLVKNSSPSEVDLGNGSNPCVTSDVGNIDFGNLNLTRNLSTTELKPDEYPIDENGIPLASQRSYTILHKANPDLHRPVVLEHTSDVQAEKINDIILENGAFSDLGMFNNSSEELIADASKNACNISQSKEYLIMKSNETELNNMISDFNNVVKKNTLISSEISEEIGETKQDLYVDDIVPISKSNEINTAESTINNAEVSDKFENPIATNTQLQNEPSTPIIESEILKNEGVVPVYEDPIVMNKNTSEELEKESLTFPSSSTISASGDDIVTALNIENSSSGLQFYLDASSTATVIIDPVIKTGNEVNQEPGFIENCLSSKTKVSDFQTQMENLSSDLEKLKMNDSIKQDVKANFFSNNDSFLKINDSLVSNDDCLSDENSKNSVQSQGMGFETELTQFIQEQFTAFDIEKICSVVDDIPELNLSKSIVLASEKFDKSFHEKTILDSGSSKANNSMNDNKFLPSALDFLDSIKGKGSGRDYSRESLYVKFDPLLQSKHSTELLDISEGDKENLIVSPTSDNSEPLIPITPLKQTINGNIPLSPLTLVSQKNESMLNTEKLNKLLDLQREITRLRESYAQKEESNKEKITNYENEIAKLTGRTCVLEEKLKESEEMEKSLVKKLSVQNESMSRLKNIVEEYLTYIAKLTDILEATRMESQKKMQTLTEERDYYMNHLQSTEQAFSDLHCKYEKCKKVVEIYKMNEETYKTNIEDLKERIEQYTEKINDMQQNAAKEMSRLQEKMNDLKVNHAQEISRFKAQLRKTELKVQTVQDALDQKVKENQELARICDELIDGKK